MVRSVQPAPGATRAIRRGGGLEHPDGRRPHRHHAATLAAGAGDAPPPWPRRPRSAPPPPGDRQPARRERAGRFPGPTWSVTAVDLDAPARERRQQRRGEVKARRRRGDGAGPGARRRSGSAPSPRRRASGTGGCTAAAAAAREPRGTPRPDRLPSSRTRARPSASRAVTVARAAPSASTTVVPTGQRRAGRRRAAQSSVARADRVEQQHLGVPLRPRDPPEQPRGQDARVVHHQAVAGPQEARRGPRTRASSSAPAGRRSSTSSRAASRGSAGSWAIRSGGSA